MGVAAHELLIGDDDQRRADFSGHDELRSGVVGQVIGATLGVGQGEGGRVSAPSGPPGPLDVVGGSGWHVAHQDCLQLTHVPPNSKVVEELKASRRSTRPG